MTQQYPALSHAPASACFAKALLPKAYRIRLAGELDEGWADWFPGMVLSTQNGETVVSGPVADQAALFGMLRTVQNLGLGLIALQPIDR